MRHSSLRPRRWVLAGLAAAAVAVTGLALASPGRVNADVFMPMLMKAQDRTFPVAATGHPTALAPTGTYEPPTLTPDPSQPTPTLRPPTRTPRPTNTPLPTDTPGPSPTPTLGGEDIPHSSDPYAIVLQLGWTDMFSGQFTDVWEQMNGTPWVTVYGDGRIIASKGLPNREQDLLVGHVDEYYLQLWLRTLAYDVSFFDLPQDSYVHPSNPKGHLRVFAEVDAGYKRLDIAGMSSFERRPPPEGPNMPILRLQGVISFARTLERWVNDNLSEPYAAEGYTLIAQEEKYQKPSFPLPRWTHKLNIKTIADREPTPKGNSPDKPPGHETLDKATGEEVRAIIIPEADKVWISENRAAMFAYGGRNYVVGARQEVPGGSQFLPDDFRAKWHSGGILPPRPPSAIEPAHQRAAPRQLSLPLPPPAGGAGAGPLPAVCVEPRARAPGPGE
jgi:hypothetical protein